MCCRTSCRIGTASECASRFSLKCTLMDNQQRLLLMQCMLQLIKTTSCYYQYY
jgi:ribosome biogenesis SPOUT family RNA methylase Rps3